MAVDFVGVMYRGEGLSDISGSSMCEQCSLHRSVCSLREQLSRAVLSLLNNALRTGRLGS
jgi:hypothetical protein